MQDLKSGKAEAAERLNGKRRGGEQTRVWNSGVPHTLGLLGHGCSRPVLPRRPNDVLVSTWVAEGNVNEVLLPIGPESNIQASTSKLN